MRIIATLVCIQSNLDLSKSTSSSRGSLAHMIQPYVGRHMMSLSYFYNSIYLFSVITFAVDVGRVVVVEPTPPITSINDMHLLTSHHRDTRKTVKYRNLNWMSFFGTYKHSSNATNSGVHLHK